MRSPVLIIYIYYIILYASIYIYTIDGSYGLFPLVPQLQIQYRNGEAAEVSRVMCARVCRRSVMPRCISTLDLFIDVLPMKKHGAVP